MMLHRTWPGLTPAAMDLAPPMKAAHLVSSLSTLTLTSYSPIFDGGTLALLLVVKTEDSVEPLSNASRVDEKLVVTYYNAARLEVRTVRDTKILSLEAQLLEALVTRALPSYLRRQRQ